MSIPKDLTDKKLKDAYLFSESAEVGPLTEKGCLLAGFIKGFDAGVLAAFESEHVQALVEALKLTLEHAKDYGDSVKDNWITRHASLEKTVKEALDKWSKRNE